MAASVFYVGTESEVSHHAQPLASEFDVKIVSADQVTELATPDDLAIFFSEHFKRFRTAITALKEVGCRTLYAIDGILEWRNAFENRETEPACPWTMRPVLCDKVAAIGRSQARMLDFWGNKNKVELVGLPRLDPLLGTETDKRQANSKFKLMVATAKWPAFTDEQRSIVEASLFGLKSWIDANPQVEVTWRLTKELDRKLEIENNSDSVKPSSLIDQLRDCDALVTTPSTTMLEGMMLGKPTAILEFNPCPQFNNVAWHIRHRDQIESVMHELTEPSAFKLAQQEFALHDTLECQSPALSRLSHLIHQMLKYPAGEAVPNLVPVESSDFFSDLGSDFLYNGFRLTESNEATELKAQIAFLERENKLYRERNELVEKEFERAKSTIDNVFNNPVVFPFIKAGELAGKLFSKPKTQHSPETNP